MVRELRQRSVHAQVTLISGLAINLLPDGQGGGIATLSAGMALSKEENCSPILRFRIGKPGNFTPPPTTTSVTFDCNELGINLVSIWYRDGAGNWGFTDSYVVVEDLQGVCTPNAAPVAAGCAPDQTPPFLMLRNGLAVTFTRACMQR